MKIVRKMPNTANTATKLCLLIMTCLLLVMSVMSGTWAILYYTYSCTCNSEDVIQGDKKSATRTNIEILSIDNRKESVEVDEGDQKSCPQVQDTDCLTTWSLLEILVVILITKKLDAEKPDELCFGKSWQAFKHDSEKG